MGERIRRMSARDVEALLRKHGFEMVSQKGSHRKWRSAGRSLQVIVPMHKGKMLPLGTLRSILVGAEIPDAEWKS